MASATRKCKVCGSEYEYCHTVRRVPGVFRWQDVACSPEHAAIYLARIAASRSPVPAEESKAVDEPVSAESPEAEPDAAVNDDMHVGEDYTSCEEALSEDS